jgi:hypothetical protein
MLRAAIEGVGSQDAFARRHGIDRTHLNQILSGKKIREHSGHAGSPPSESVCAQKLGFMPGTPLPADLVCRRNVSVSWILDFAWSAFSTNRLSWREPATLPLHVIRIRPSPSSHPPQDK